MSATDTGNAATWDPLRWYPDTLVRRWRTWLDARPWRRRALWTLVLVSAFVVFPAVVGAVVATAQPGSGVSQIDGLSWMNVRDSNGVPLSSYQFVTDKGSLFNPANTVLWTLLGLEFVGYMAIVTSAIWVVTFTFSFEWLDMFSSALSGTAQALVRQIATPMVLITAATIGAFFVAWFIVRGFHAKATMQVVTMLGVAILGPIFLAAPLEDVLSSDGLLVKGRDVGLSVAAGLNGNGNPNPKQLVSIMQHDLADNFARKPLQVWNFGHVIDNNGACETAWSAGVLTGEDDNIKEAVKNCGDSAAHNKASNPSVGQLGTGLILLICATLLMLFAVYLGLKVTKAAMDTIYHGFMAIFGFAAGGFVYGPTQTFLVRNIVDAFISAARMAAFTVFLGVYLLFMGNIFDQARGQVMSVIVILCAVELVAISQVRRLNNSLERGNNWVANRFAFAIQGNSGGSGGGGGGTALGMGGAQLPGGGGGGGMSGLAALAALSTVNNSPLTGWLAMGTPSPLNPLARRKKVSDMVNFRTADSREELYAWSQMGRNNWRNKAISRAAAHGGVGNAIGMANALDGLGDSKVPEAQLAALLLDLPGATHYSVQQAQRAVAVQGARKSTNPYGFQPLQKAVAAAYAVEAHLDQPLGAQAAFAAQAEIAASNFLRHTNRPVAGVAVNRGFVNRVRTNWDSDVALRNAITPDEWNQVGRNTRFAIAHEVATAHQQAAVRHRLAPTEANRRELMRWTNRIANLDHMGPEMGLDPWDP
ncbi:hypothetical protein [Nocardia sp. NBC_01329]|uniref:hypothetical protein n=1 Tax=Nocardia sp. NBC_01329 TaxID=2903594 RepID=UPI002E12601A|nr:hypothetical protein OG405_20165 [Nocardia sp. NBC_01329]